MNGQSRRTAKDERKGAADTMARVLPLPVDLLANKESCRQALLRQIDEAAS